MKPSGRTLLLWTLVVLFTVTSAALLAAPLHERLLAWEVLDAPGVPANDHRGFLMVFRRLLLIPLVLAFLLFARPWRDLGLRRYGLLGPRARVRPALIGLVLTVAALCAVLGGQLLTGGLRWEDPLRWHEFTRRLGRGLAGALVLSLAEEWFFRGWLVERLGKRRSSGGATALAAALFALLHAFRPSTLTVTVSHDAAGALAALRGWLGYMLDPLAFGASFVGLFGFALLLSAARRRTGTLWAPVGVHVGAAWVLFTYGALTVREPARTWAGTRLLYDGPVLWLLLAVATWWLVAGRGGAPPSASSSASGAVPPGTSMGRADPS